MPKYEFRCNVTGKHFEVYASIAEYDPAKVVSPYTGTNDVTRIIRRVRFIRSDSSRWDRLEEGDESVLDDLDDADPQTLGKALRHFGTKLGEDMGPEFQEVVERLESGQSPEEIERTMEFSDDLAPDMPEGNMSSDMSLPD
jgi:hypothetical protein